MIKDFEEYKVYRCRYLSESITTEESAEIKKEMGIFRKKNPHIFKKLNEEKWSMKGMEMIHPDGSVTIMK